MPSAASAVLPMSFDKCDCSCAISVDAATSALWFKLLLFTGAACWPLLPATSGNSSCASGFSKSFSKMFSS